MLHFVDRCLALVPTELGQAPVDKHSGMQEILVDRSQFVGKNGVEVPDDLDVTLHVAFSSAVVAHSAGMRVIRASVSPSSVFAQDVQRPQPRPTPSPCARSCVERAPSSTARTISRSVIALQRQMYMDGAS